MEQPVKNIKPLGKKSYGSIPHLIGSRLGSGDYHAHEGQVKICTEKSRDKHDIIIVQEKLDGGNVGVVKLNGKIIAITRAGYLAVDSPYKTHHVFERYVREEEKRFKGLLKEGERICGEWLFTAVGTIYNLPHEPFVPFDLITGVERVNYSEFSDRIDVYGFVKPRVISIGKPLSIEQVEDELDKGTHGHQEPVEGAIWRVERKQKVDFLAKYVRHSKQDGKYLEHDIINTMPKKFDYLINYFNPALKG